LPTIGYRFSGGCTVAGGDDTVPLPTAAKSFSIAILPVNNRTGNAEFDYLAEGLAEGAIRILSELPTLIVIARASTFRFRHNADDALDFARSLGVYVLLTGELKYVGDRLAYSIELADAGEGAVIISRQYWLGSSDWMDVQADVAFDVARGLHLDVERSNSGRLGGHPTTSPEAYQFFLRGEFLGRRIGPDALHQALAAFAEALRLDDRFALAWGSTAECHLMLGIYFGDPNVHMPCCKAAAFRALELDGSLQLGHACLAMVRLVYEWDLAAAEAELSSAAICRRAISTFGCAAHLLSQSGRGREAEHEIRQNLAADPYNAALVAELGCNNYYRRRYEQALYHFHAAADLDSRAPYTYWGLGRALGQMGRCEDALAILREFKSRAGFEPPILTAEIGYVLGRAGRAQEALEIAHQLREASGQIYLDPYLISLVYLGMGDLDHAFEWLEKAVEGRSAFAISISTEPKWQIARSDSRFQAMLSRIGLTAP
jgi:TolB-like protein/tetratricopeptide (TPR) repeat protein